MHGATVKLYAIQSTTFNFVTEGIVDLLQSFEEKF